MPLDDLHFLDLLFESGDRLWVRDAQERPPSWYSQASRH